MVVEEMWAAVVLLAVLTAEMAGVAGLPVVQGASAVVEREAAMGWGEAGKEAETA